VGSGEGEGKGGWGMIITYCIVCNVVSQVGAVGSASCVVEGHADDCRRWGGETLLLVW
jgi:hypothetical protein